MTAVPQGVCLLVYQSSFSGVISYRGDTRLKKTRDVYTLWCLQAKKSIIFFLNAICSDLLMSGMKEEAVRTWIEATIQMTA